jgi:hypothetical protein
MQISKKMFCKDCGKKLIENSKYCSNCGKEIVHDEESILGAEITEESVIEKQPVKTKSKKRNFIILTIICGLLGGYLFTQYEKNVAYENIIRQVDSYFKGKDTIYSYQYTEPIGEYIPIYSSWFYPDKEAVEIFRQKKGGYDIVKLLRWTENSFDIYNIKISSVGYKMQRYNTDEYGMYIKFPENYRPTPSEANKRAFEHYVKGDVVKEGDNDYYLFIPKIKNNYYYISKTFKGRPLSELYYNDQDVKVFYDVDIESFAIKGDDESYKWKLLTNAGISLTLFAIIFFILYNIRSLYTGVIAYIWVSVVYFILIGIFFKPLLSLFGQLLQGIQNWITAIVAITLVFLGIIAFLNSFSKKK